MVVCALFGSFDCFGLLFDLVVLWFNCVFCRFGFAVVACFYMGI